jgi:acyl-CoA thioester hydrolase
VATWSAPVRYGEVDQQGVVFNAHYLLYCDETLNAFCRERDLLEFAEVLRLVTSTLTWQGPGHWGDVIEVDARCARIGKSSLTMAFVITASGRPCCTVETVYVHADAAGAPQPIPEDVRATLSPAGRQDPPPG